jgi:hypothetical protein
MSMRSNFRDRNTELVSANIIGCWMSERFVNFIQHGVDSGRPTRLAGRDPWRTAIFLEKILLLCNVIVKDKRVVQ